uniref:Transcriptional regulatory protein n=1 Tax=uncultured bacterium UPO76 TaxID=1776993 RepID=A0A140DZX9_9BACT|nr:transcriptional regulatory protein [uncultured bacterium UPO76]
MRGKQQGKARRTRAHGEESRQRILDAAAEIAGERGYGGTSIALVSERSGLPASSIYWHFEDKDRLIAAVIERSFNRWLQGMGEWAPPRPGASRDELFTTAIRRTAKALTDAPDFLRLGLMLSLEHRPDEATARTRFLQAREQAYEQLVASYEAHFGGTLGAPAVRALATLTMAAADGLFIAHEVDANVDLGASFDLLAAAILGAADHLIARRKRSRKETR